jgi:hypothetical protein
MGDPVAVPSTARIRLRLLDINGKALAGKNCVVDWGGTSITATTDSDGVLQVDVSTRYVQGYLTVDLFRNAVNNPQIGLILKTAWTADSVEGMKRRLNNLGYLALDSATIGTMDKPALRALDRFRFDNGLVDATGLPVGPTAPPFDAATIARIQNAHDTIGNLVSLPPPTP